MTPLVIDLDHPFPFIANLSISLIFLLRDPVRQERMYARVKIPSGMKQWVSISADAEPGTKVFVPLHEIVRGNVHKLYSGMTLSGATLVRLTRDAEVDLDDDAAAELRQTVEDQVRQRRYEPVVRLEFGPGSDADIKEMLRVRFQLSSSDLYDMAGEVDYTTLFEFTGLPMPELHDGEWTPLPLPASRVRQPPSSPRFRRATCSSTIHTRVSMPPWNTLPDWRRHSLCQIADSCSGTRQAGCMRDGNQGALR